VEAVADEAAARRVEDLPAPGGTVRIADLWHGTQNKAAAAAGLGTSLGLAGVALAVLAVFLVGNPLSGLTAAPELLPQPWGAVGQLLPPGAGGTLLRAVAFFGGAGAAAQAWALTAWAAGGLLLAAIPAASRLRAPSRTRSHGPIPLRAQGTA